MKIECDEFYEWLRLDGEKFSPSGDAEGEFEVLASHIGQAHLADLPGGVSIRLCNRVIGSSELFHRHPYCSFEHTMDGVLMAHGETAFFIEADDVTPAVARKSLSDLLFAAKRSLQPLVADGTVVSLKERVHEEIAYLTYSVLLNDQRILDAEVFIAALESRMHEGLHRPLLFICHASEDKPFVDRLVKELDSRALHAWYDKGEIW